MGVAEGSRSADLVGFLPKTGLGEQTSPGRTAGTRGLVRC